MRVQARLGRRLLTFEVSAGELATIDRADAFVPVALLVAMREGYPLHVDAAVSPRLVYHLNHVVVPLLVRIDPSLHAVAVTAAQPAPPPRAEAGGVCIGFSGGVDSISALDDHFFRDVEPGFRVTHLLFNDVGSHPQHGHAAIFARRHRRVAAVAASLRLPLIVTRSNQDEILGRDFARFDVLRNATVPLLLQSQMHRFLYASAHSYERMRVGPGQTSGVVGSVLLPALSTEAIDMHLVGAQYSRVGKIERIADLPFTREHIDVCFYSPDHVANCGECDKCMRTLLALELGGKLEAFANRFDLDAYRNRRTWFIAKTLYGRATSDHELRDLMHRTRFRPTLRMYALGASVVRLQPWLSPTWEQRLRPWRRTLAR
jgi:hypothetical protein